MNDKKSSAFIQVNNVWQEYGDQVVLERLNLSINEGEFCTLVGASGCGKSTFLRLLLGQERASRGEILLGGQPLAAEPDASRGVVFQRYSVFPHLSVLENVRVALQRKRGNSFDFWRSDSVLDAFNERARELIDWVGLSEFAETTAVEMPYGRKRALEIATTLALEPEMMLLDEPTAGMGHEDVGRISGLIKRVAKGRTVLMVEHNLSVVSDLSDTITVLARGEVLAEGDYAAVSKNPDVIQAYMGAGHA